ncbi:hypothetical protein U8607_08465 [Methylobacterium durans]|uniref:hypothetical protein n=1 Tax=Methylobacterium durans TaxID=2202825 RepID=UPI002B00396A|nr:hypothetical protein [Methylobacterium durans]MEA1832115.1 hypothetical protein [Methylobacterium durans]
MQPVFRAVAATLPEPVCATHAVMPCDWVLAGGLRAFRDDASHAGRSTAALKIFLALALQIPSGSRLRRERGSVLLAYEELSALTGLSHQLVASGNKRLADQGLIRTRPEGQGRRLRYFLEGYDEAPARRRLPCRLVLPGSAEPVTGDLRRFSTRQVGDLHALKAYLCLCALGRPGADRMLLDLDRLSALTNIAAGKAHRALESLSAHGLAALRPVPASAGTPEVWEVGIGRLQRCWTAF